MVPGPRGDGGAPPLIVAAEEATFGTLAGLGPFRMSASVRRTTGVGPGSPLASDATEESLEVVELRWRDADHWSYLQRRDGRVRSEVVVWDAVAWAGDGDGSPERKGDAEPYRVQLATTWDPWEWGLEGLTPGITLAQQGVELLDGRRTLRHLLAPAPPPDKPRRGWTVTAVEGEVWIDEATAVRLRGRVLASATSGTRTRTIDLVFSVDDLGLDPGISAPARDKP